MATINANRRKVLIEQENEIPDFKANFHRFGRVVKCQAGDLFIIDTLSDDAQIDDANAETTQIIAKLPQKFRHVIYAKPNDIIIVAPETDEFNTKSAWNITAILSQQHIIAFIKDRSLPALFTPEQYAHKAESANLIHGKAASDRILTSTYAANSDDDELPVYNNRKRNPFLGSGSSSDDDSD